MSMSMMFLFLTFSRQLDALTTLMNHGADANTKDNQYYTPLHLAALSGKEWKDLVAALLRTKRKGLKVNERNTVGRTPLHEACYSGYTETVLLLLNHTGIGVNIVDNNGDTPLHLAVIKQHYDVVTLMLSKVSVKLNSKNHKKMTPLLEAVSEAHLGIIKKLISRGAGINVVDNDGNNCLHLAVKKKSFHSEEEYIPILDECCTELKRSKDNRLSGVVVACYLARQGADFYHKNNKNNTPLDLIENRALKEKLKACLLSRCMLCEVNEATVELQPCAHNAVCGECYTIKLRRCPKCKTCISPRVFDCPKLSDKGVQTVAESVKNPNFEEKQRETMAKRVGSQKLKEKDLLRVAKRLGSNWWQVGIFLGIQATELKIDDDSNDTARRGFLMLYEWFKGCDPGTRNLETLRAALEEAECSTALQYLS
ncbi:E3 ubiquitin-protein ligase MIB2 isoform X1 [Octopus bimaculoides]|uniref:E3 ubiquitin-protein ligase MIB2 isoform X1 n=1 Tax=Octopus bimaculoides TaxID=37653 RepID=UPI0022E991C6|nr:E3 ubiquitin-protein ligase MIB2 isoform X1 [Octopus bimaculoides]